METLIVQPESDDKLRAVKAVLKALKIKFVSQGTPDAPDGKNFYNAEFEAKMKRAEEDKKAGRFRAIKTADLWK